MPTPVPPSKPGVILMDLSGNYVAVTGNVTSLNDIEITDSVLPTGAATEATLANVATEATLAALSAKIGTVADAAWTGVGDATVISLLKAIALNTV